MRPNRATLSLLLPFLLAVPAGAQALAAVDPAAVTTAQALPLAEPPAAMLVPATPAAAGEPVPTVEKIVADDELLAASPDTPDDPAVAEEIDSESAELEDLRRAEEESHVQDQGPGVAPHQAGGGRV